jgi:pimeloyl-ACP methyl ester carboxylesterase
MDAIAGLHFFPLEITKDGRLFNAQQKSAIEDAVRQAGAARITDLFVVSHGWNNDMAEARELYNTLFGNVAAMIPGRAPLANRKFAIVGVFWPSKKFADEDLIPAGGAVSVEDDGEGVTSSAVKEKLESLKDTFDVPDAAALDRAKTLVDALDDSPAKQREFVDLIRSLVPQNPSDTTEDASDQFLQRPGDEILKALAPPSMFNIPPAEGGSALGIDDQAGGIAGLGDLFSGMKAAAWRLLNFATYYQMKERAGVVGKGLNGMLGAVRQLRPDLRIHLVGHSFGARVVTAAVDGPAEFQPSSLSLLQGAFSHNGFTEKFDAQSDGFFRKVVAKSKVNGPILATHTVNDRAVGIAYPLASRLSADNRSAFGDENDVFGGIGRNGAVKMKPGEFVKGRLLPHTNSYQFVAKKVHNLRADEFISGHSDVTGRQVANALLHAIS